MEAIDELGAFWIAGKRDEERSGRLVFDPRDGIRLMVVGEFSGADSSVDIGGIRLHSPSPVLGIRFHGYIGSRRVTLVDAFRSRATTPHPGVATCEFVANGLFIGHHVDQGDTFDHLQVELTDLDRWVGRSGIEQTINWHAPEGQPLYSLTYKRSEGRPATFGRGNVTLFEGVQTGGEQPGIKVWPAISIKYDEAQPFDKLWRDAGRIEKLVSLCIDGSSSIEKVLLTSKAIQDPAPGGPRSRLIEFLVPMLGYVEPAKRVARNTYRMYLTFDELGGTEVVARWLDAVDDFEDALDSLMSITYARQMFGENRFLNVTYAAEAFHRRTFAEGETYLPEAEYASLLRTILDSVPEKHRDFVQDKLFSNQTILLKRLKELATAAGSAAKPLIGSKHDWSFAVSRVRNSLTHLGGGIKVEGESLRHLTESVFAVVRVCMLLRMGVQASVLESKAESENIVWYRDALRAAIANVKRQANGPKG